MRPGAPSEASNDDARALDALPFAGEMLRKGLHVVALVIPAGMVLLGRAGALWLLLPVTLAALGADVLRAQSQRFSRMIRGVFGRMMRPREWPEEGGRPVVNGATWVLVSAAMLTLLFPVELGASALAAFLVADAAAAVVGLRLGRRRWPGTHRTLEGSLAFVAVAFPLLVAFGQAPVGAAVAAALVGAAAEALEGPLNDNIRVPMVMAAVLFIWTL